MRACRAHRETCEACTVQVRGRSNKPSSYYEGLVDVMEELYKFTFMNSRSSRLPGHRGCFGWNRGTGFAHDGRLRLWANGLAFSRRLIRTGVPGSSKNSRRELTR